MEIFDLYFMHKPLPLISKSQVLPTKLFLVGGMLDYFDEGLMVD